MTTNLITHPAIPHPLWVPEFYASKKRSVRSRQRTVSLEGVTTVGTLIDQQSVLPSNAILLGQCDDGLPFLLEMHHPETGAILLACDAGSGKTHQLQVIVESALKTSTARDLQLVILTFNPAEWDGIQKREQFKRVSLGTYAWVDTEAEKLIAELMTLAEARRDGNRQGPNVLLLLDDLNFIEGISFEAQFNLRWLMEYGSQYNIWLVGTINAALVHQFNYWVEIFRTRIVGRIREKDYADLITLRTGSSATSLEPGHFRFWTGKDWLTYGLPLLGG